MTTHCCKGGWEVVFFFFQHTAILNRLRTLLPRNKGDRDIRGTIAIFTTKCFWSFIVKSLCLIKTVHGFQLLSWTECPQFINSSSRSCAVWSRECKASFLPQMTQPHLGLAPAGLRPLPEPSRPFQAPANESLLLKTGGFVAPILLD